MRPRVQNQRYVEKKTPAPIDKKRQIPSEPRKMTRLERIKAYEKSEKERREREKAGKVYVRPKKTRPPLVPDSGPSRTRTVEPVRR